MSLQTFRVPPVCGRVCYATGYTSAVGITVECPSLRVAFFTTVPRGAKLAVGDWVRVSGTVRVDPGLKKNGEPRDENLAYFQDPHDGSEKSHWVFFQMRDAAVSSAPPPAVEERIMSAIRRLEDHRLSWTDGLTSDSLSETLSVLGSAGAELSKAYSVRLERDREAREQASLIEIIV